MEVIHKKVCLDLPDSNGVIRFEVPQCSTFLDVLLVKDEFSVWYRFTPQDEMKTESVSICVINTGYSFEMDHDKYKFCKTLISSNGIVWYAFVSKLFFWN